MLNGLFSNSRKEVETKTVMAVGDDPESLAFLSSTLEGDGYRVLSAAGVEAALDALIDLDMPDLFISDFRDPQVDGTEFVRRLSLRYGKSSLAPVIFLLDSVEDEQVAHETGAQDVLAKPLSTEALLQCVKSVVAKI